MTSKSRFDGPTFTLPKWDGLELLNWPVKDFEVELHEYARINQRQILGFVIKCGACMLITMHKMFHSHYCDPDKEDDFNLTDKEQQNSEKGICHLCQLIIFFALIILLQE